MARVYFALGSNLGDREAMIRTALKELSLVVSLEKCSSFIASKAVGVVDQPDFLNAVCRAETDASPEELLRKIQEIEQKLGRIESVHWGPRVIDIDILLYDLLVVSTPMLTVPHPRMWERDFVVVPLAEVL